MLELQSLFLTSEKCKYLLQDTPSSKLSSRSQLIRINTINSKQRLPVQLCLSFRTWIHSNWAFRLAHHYFICPRPFHLDGDIFIKTKSSIDIFKMPTQNMSSTAMARPSAKRSSASSSRASAQDSERHHKRSRDGTYLIQ